jgi:hypothetical protein
MDNVFHIICHISNKVCIIIIDCESCANITCTTLIKKLNLNTTKHLRPYRFQWLNECHEVKMNN